MRHKLYYYYRMAETSNQRRSRLLGMSFGAACNQLRKAILFKLANDADLTKCHRCGKQIETLAEFSIEHKDAWERAADPVATFFNLENVTFSHLVCNSGAALKPNKKFASKKESNQFWNSKRTYEQRRPEREPARPIRPISANRKKAWLGGRVADYARLESG